MRSVSLLVYKAVDGAIEVGPVHCPQLTPTSILLLKTQGALQCATISKIARHLSLHHAAITYLCATRQEIARDYHANWMTAVDMLNDDVYIGGESDCNVFTLRRNAGKNQREPCFTLVCSSQYKPAKS